VRTVASAIYAIRLPAFAFGFGGGPLERGDNEVLERLALQCRRSLDPPMQIVLAPPGFNSMFPCGTWLSLVGRAPDFSFVHLDACSPVCLVVIADRIARSVATAVATVTRKARPPRVQATVPELAAASPKARAKSPARQRSKAPTR
jgi:hypothetical protein